MAVAARDTATARKPFSLEWRGPDGSRLDFDSCQNRLLAEQATGRTRPTCAGQDQYENDCGVRDWLPDQERS